MSLLAQTQLDLAEVLDLDEPPEVAIRLQEGLGTDLYDILSFFQLKHPRAEIILSVAGHAFRFDSTTTVQDLAAFRSRL